MTTGLVGQNQISTFVSPTNGTTPINADTVRSNDNTIKTSYDAHDIDPSIHVQSSTNAARPSAATAGTAAKWIDNDTYRAYYSDGAAWHELAYLSTAGGTITGDLVVTGAVTASGNVTGDDVFSGAGSAHRWTGRSIITSPADGKIAFFNLAETGFTSLALGGLTSSFPALKVSGAGIVARLADDSANTTVTGSRLIGGTDVSTAVAYGVASDGTAPSSNGAAITATLGHVTSVASATVGTIISGEHIVKATTAGASSYYANRGYAWAAHTSGTLNNLHGVQGIVEPGGNGGTVTNADGISGFAFVATGATVTNLSILHALAPAGSGTSTNLWGVKVENMGSGAAQWAIQTGTGLVQFGDYIVGTASTTSRASLRLPHGSAPTVPVDGDMWTTTAGLFVRINGSTVGPLS